MGKRDRSGRKPSGKDGKGAAGKKADQPTHSPAAVVEELVRVVERGSFAVAMCACGWSGPGRRARKRAREDAAAHLAEAHPAARTHH